MYQADDRTARFQRALDVLRDANAPFTADAIYALSDLQSEQVTAFQTVWATMSVARRQTLITRLVETSETNFEFDFDAIIHPALNDAAMEVRSAAVEGVYDSAPRAVIERVNQMAQDDPFSEVRAKAATALGQFILLGEYEELPQALATRLQDTVLALYRNPNEDLEVRRRALEAISNCSRDGVTDMIRESYYADELLMRVSAVFAMGRTYDAEWAPQVMDELASEEPQLRFEAARAAGELELSQALPTLSEMAYEDDRELQLMAIWAMGEIGGTRVDALLERLAAMAEANDDDDLAEAIEEAQASAMLATADESALLGAMDGLIPMFDFNHFEDYVPSDDDDDDEYADLPGYNLDDDDDDDDEDWSLDELADLEDQDDD